MEISDGQSSGGRSRSTQPEVLPQTGEIFDMKALVHWEHAVERSGALRPVHPRRERDWLDAAFRAAVLRGGVPLGARVARSVPADPPLLLSVNHSARQFEHLDLAQNVTQVLQETELDTSRLNRAIKEGAMMEDAQSIIMARFEN